jgi:adenosine kinase
LRIFAEEHTTTGFTITDTDDNQITGYYAGAMSKSAVLGLRDTVDSPAAVIIGPNDRAAMLRLVRECREAGVRWVFDPSHQLPQLSGDDLEEGFSGAWIAIGNDYELEVIRQRTGRDAERLLELAEIVVTTYGRNGSEVRRRGGAHRVAAAPAAREVDPVGAGDAYRAGLIHALLHGASLEQAAQVASVAASFTVEQTGTVEHRFTREEFARRYEESYPESYPL